MKRGLSVARERAGVRDQDREAGRAPEFRPAATHSPGYMGCSTKARTDLLLQTTAANELATILNWGVLPGGARGTRTLDPLLAKPGQDVQHCRWRGTMRSQVSIPVRQCPSALVSVVGVMPGLTSLII